MEILETVSSFFDEPWRKSLAIMVATSVGVLCQWVLFAVLSRMSIRSGVPPEDAVIGFFRKPAMYSLGVFGAWKAVGVTFVGSQSPWWLLSLLYSWVIILWTNAAINVSGSVLARAAVSGEGALVGPRVLPLFQMIAKGGIVSAGIYFIFLSWHLNLSAWIASAGIVGIAVGFGAKDSLSNLFGGLAILADSPYQLGDTLVLPTGERGRVVEIGLRSTRLLTRDDIELCVPNSLMANTMVTNETGGPKPPHRINVKVQVGYGTDIDQVKTVLIEETAGVFGVMNNPSPMVMFESFGDSGLGFIVQVWLDHSSNREQVLNDLNSCIYKRLNSEGIELPFPKRDVFLHNVD
jgi:MscS family membrane protein